MGIIHSRRSLGIVVILILTVLGFQNCSSFTSGGSPAAATVQDQAAESTVPSVQSQMNVILRSNPTQNSDLQSALTQLNSLLSELQMLEPQSPDLQLEIRQIEQQILSAMALLNAKVAQNQTSSPATTPTPQPSPSPAPSYPTPPNNCSMQAGHSLHQTGYSAGLYSQEWFNSHTLWKNGPYLKVINGSTMCAESCTAQGVPGMCGYLCFATTPLPSCSCFFAADGSAESVTAAANSSSFDAQASAGVCQ